MTCFGLNRHGQAGGAADGDFAVLVSVDLEGSVSGLAAGARTSCAILASGQVDCWGYRLNGQTGTGDDTEYSPSPRRLTGFGPDQPALEVALGLEAGCVRSASGVSCFGASVHGELGAVDLPGSAEPRAVAGLPADVVQVDAGRAHFCARTAAGAVWCWGRNTERQLGRDDAVVSPPAQLALPGAAVDIALGNYHTCVLLETGRVLCAGRTTEGVVSDTSSELSDGFVEVPELTAVEIESGLSHACGLTPIGRVKCWGSDSEGQMGTGVAGSSQVITPVPVFFLPK